MDHQTKHAGYDEFTLTRFGLLLADTLETKGMNAALRYAQCFLELYSKSQSPIETNLAGLLASIAFHGKINIDAQAAISDYRCDFLLTSSLFNVRGIVVECDGHLFHERTKEQAARDRKRDRKMQNLGYVVLRFTGSEIRSNFQTVADDLKAAISRAKGASNG